MNDESEILSLLPPGSIVKLKDLKADLMIAGLLEYDPEKEVLYDYAGVLYPVGYAGIEGPLAPKCFMQEDIDQVIFRGYENQEWKNFLQNVHESVRHALELARGTEDMEDGGEAK